MEQTLAPIQSVELIEPAARAVAILVDPRLISHVSKLGEKHSLLSLDEHRAGPVAELTADGGLAATEPDRHSALRLPAPSATLATLKYLQR